MQSGIVDLTAVRFHRPLILPHQRILRVHLLAGDRVLGEQSLIAGKVDAGIVEQGDVAIQLSLGLVEQDLERARVDLGQQVSGLYHLAFAEIHLEQGTVDLGVYRNEVARRDRAERIQPDADVSDANLGHRYRLRTVTARAFHIPASAA